MVCVDRLMNMIGELVIKEAMLCQVIQTAGLHEQPDVVAGLDAIRQLASDIQESVMAIRAQPLKLVFQRMHRILREFDGVPAVLLDTTPSAFVAMAGDRVHEGYRRWVSRYEHGPGVFKVDWLLSEPVPWTNADVRRAGTIHVAGTMAETIDGESAPAAGRITDTPYVLAVQPTVPDPTRAPGGEHVFWAYVHVPHGSDVDMTEAMERQVERFAPGFRDTIVGRVTKNAPQMEAWNPNHVGGDISNGEASLRQMLARPVPRWNTYKTPVPGTYLASAATPPGPAVHGACGDNAARVALREVFGVRHAPRLRPAPSA